jgi:hypothetical protein
MTTLSILLFIAGIISATFGQIQLGKAKKELQTALKIHEGIDQFNKALDQKIDQIAKKSFHRSLYEIVIQRLEQDERYELCDKLKAYLRENEGDFIPEPEFMAVLRLDQEKTEVLI